MIHESYNRIPRLTWGTGQRQAVEDVREGLRGVAKHHTKRRTDIGYRDSPGAMASDRPLRRCARGHEGQLDIIRRAGQMCGQGDAGCLGSAGAMASKRPLRTHAKGWES